MIERQVSTEIVTHRLDSELVFFERISRSIAWPDRIRSNLRYYRRMAADDTVARRARAEARRERMTVEVVDLGAPKPSPYRDSSPDERLAAATRLIEHHAALRGEAPRLPRAEWPGEIFRQ